MKNALQMVKIISGVNLFKQTRFKGFACELNRKAKIRHLSISITNDDMSSSWKMLELNSIGVGSEVYCEMFVVLYLCRWNTNRIKNLKSFIVSSKRCRVFIQTAVAASRIFRFADFLCKQSTFHAFWSKIRISRKKVLKNWDCLIKLLSIVLEKSFMVENS